VADWLACDAVTAGWVSLDSGDNDPKRFWRYLLLAADQAGSAAGAVALQRLDAAGSDVLLRLLPAPSSLRQLASELFITPNTLKTHLRAIYRKLGAESREEAVIQARERGLV